MELLALERFFARWFWRLGMSTSRSMAAATGDLGPGACCSSGIYWPARVWGELDGLSSLYAPRRKSSLPSKVRSFLIGFLFSFLPSALLLLIQCLMSAFGPLRVDGHVTFLRQMPVVAAKI